VSQPAPGQAGVLIVDDDRHIRDILRELFLSSGYQAQVAADGREALERFDAERPMTVTDVHMFVWTGWSSKASHRS
jgi:CheY-like chemotaxis protein